MGDRRASRHVPPVTTRKNYSTQRMAEFKELDKPWSWALEETVLCPVCNEQINAFGQWKRHPVLKTLQCTTCYDFYHRGKWVKDAEGFYEHCRWCGEGGNLLGCDDCIESFCRQCIQRNFGRGGISAAEETDNWKCYLCNPRPIRKLQEFASKLQKANQQREEWQHETKRKAMERKLKKAKQARLTLSTSNIEVNSNGANGNDEGHSTDEEEIDRKLHVLIKRLESKLENPEKSAKEKQSVSKVLDNINTQVNALHNKTKRMEKEWDILEPPNEPEPESGSESDQSAVIVTQRKTQKVSSDEFSDEEAVIEAKKKRSVEMKKKKENAERIRIQRQLEIGEKMAAEEAKRRIDMDKQKERLAKDKAAKEEQETTRKSQPKVVLESSDEEPSDDKPIPESDAGDDIEFSDDNGSNKSESEKESGDESVPNFLATSDEEEEEVKDRVETDDDDDMEIDALVKKTSQKKKKPEEEEQVEPAKVEENAKKNIVDSDGEEKENLPKKKKTNKLLEGKITISSDSEEEPVPKAQTKKRGEKKKSGKKQKRAELSSSGDDGHDEAA